MAQWTISRTKRRTLNVNYRRTGYEHACGELRADTPETLVLEWVMSQGAARPWDVVRFPDGRIGSIMPPAKA